MLITVGETKAKIITNNTSGSIKALIVEMSKNIGQNMKQAQHIANINTNNVVVNPLNGLQSLYSIASPVNVKIQVDIVAIVDKATSPTSSP